MRFFFQIFSFLFLVQREREKNHEHCTHQKADFDVKCIQQKLSLDSIERVLEALSL